MTDQPMTLVEAADHVDTYDVTSGSTPYAVAVRALRDHARAATHPAETECPTPHHHPLTHCPTCHGPRAATHPAQGDGE